jgi:hypothetical protein
MHSHEIERKNELRNMYTELNSYLHLVRNGECNEAGLTRLAYCQRGAVTRPAS